MTASSPHPARAPSPETDNRLSCTSCGMAPLLPDEEAARLCNECGAYRVVHGVLPDRAWVQERLRRANGSISRASSPAAVEVDDLRWQLTRAKSALENWGQHHSWCAVMKGADAQPCDCGLVQALNDATPVNVANSVSAINSPLGELRSTIAAHLDAVRGERETWEKLAIAGSEQRDAWEAVAQERIADLERVEAERERAVEKAGRLETMLCTVRDHAFIADAELLQSTVEQIDALLVELRSTPPTPPA